MLGKLISFALTGVIIFAVAGCGDEEEKKNSETNGVTIDAANGEVVSTAEARTFFSEMETEREEITAENVSKYTYWFKTSMETATGATYSMTAGSRYSKDDSYLYTWTNTVNQPMYEYNGDSTEAVQVGTIYNYTTGIYTYIDEDGMAVEALHGAYSGVYQGEVGNDSYQQWSYLSETTENAQEAFEEGFFAELLDIMATLLDYENQMAQTIEPMVSTDIAMSGIALQSKGKGHLCVTMEMLGMSYFIEYTDYHLSYMKMDMGAGTALVDPELKSMTMEMYFKVGECEISYPDLTQYEYSEEAVTPILPDVELDLDLPA